MKINCKTFWGTKHHFGRWTRKGEHNTLRLDNTVIAKHLIQERVCEVCGFIQSHCQEIIKV